MNNTTAIATSSGKLLALIIKDWNYGTTSARLASEHGTVGQTGQMIAKHARSTVNSY